MKLTFKQTKQNGRSLITHGRAQINEVCQRDRRALFPLVLNAKNGSPHILILCKVCSPSRDRVYTEVCIVSYRQTCNGVVSPFGIYHSLYGFVWAETPRLVQRLADALTVLS